MMKSVRANTFILDYREQEDRRSFESPAKVPIIDNTGKIIQRDRRNIPDRRIANIQVTEIDAHFDDELFK